MQPHILLKNGMLLVHDDAGHVVPRQADLLISDNEINRIEDSMNPSEGTQVIDCSRALVSPGFINTHHHLWQTQLKGVHANHTLLEYFCHGEVFPADCSWLLSLRSGIFEKAASPAPFSPRAMTFGINSAERWSRSTLEQPLLLTTLTSIIRRSIGKAPPGTPLR